jgi:hypothetical protein
MRYLLFLLVFGWLALSPFVFIKRPWALRMLKRVRTGFFIYVVVIVTAAIIALVMRWEQFYG